MNFLIKPLFDLFKKPLEEKLGQNINLTDIHLSIKEIFYKFLNQEFVNECCTTLIKKTSKKVLENSNDKNEPLKSHNFGVLNQIYNDSTEGHDLIKLGEYTTKFVIRKRIPILNKITEFELTEDNFSTQCSDNGFTLANPDKSIMNNILMISLFQSFLIFLRSQSDDPIVNNVLTIFSVGFTLAVIAKHYKADIQNCYDYYRCNTEYNTEKNIHKELANELISATILDDLLQELIDEELKEKTKASKQKTYESKNIEKPICVNNEELDYYSNFSNPNIGRVHHKKIKIQEKIIKITQKLDPVQPNIRITWNVNNKEYTYCSNAADKQYVPLHSNNSYLSNYAQNNYAYFDKALVRSIAGDKVKYDCLKKAFREATVVKPKNESGFTYRPNYKGEWTYKLKVVHKKGVGHLNMMFKQIAETKSVANNGDVTISKLFIPTK